MAARRLLILMLAVLALSTFGAALLAPRPTPQPGATTTTTTDDSSTSGTAAEASGRLIEVSVQAGAGRPEAIRVRPGDQLELTVHSRIAGQVEIARFGALEYVGPNQPARFSLLLAEPGHFAVRLAGSERIVARVEVTAQPRRGQSPQRKETRRTR